MNSVHTILTELIQVASGPQNRNVTGVYN